MDREFVRTSHLKVGQVLAANLYGEDLRVLLREGSRLTDRAIEAIKEQGYKGIYVQIGEEGRQEYIPVPPPLLGQTAQIMLVSGIKHIFTDKEVLANPGSGRLMSEVRKIYDSLDDFVDMLIEHDENKTLIFEQEDSRTMKNWIYFHSLNVGLISGATALRMGLSEKEIQDIAFSGVMHDAGKMLLGEELYSKEKLTAQDRRVLRTHPRMLFDILKKFDGLTINSLYGILQHHEKMDGTGYPNGIEGDTITLSGKIVAAADKLDNLISVSPYNKEPLEVAEAVEVLFGMGEFYDEEVLRAMLSVVAPYSTGIKVKLSNGKTGLVLKNVQEFPLRPYVLVGREVYDLAHDPARRCIIVEGLA